MASVGRFISEFRKWKLKAEDVYADVGGMGIVMCDALRAEGWDVRRVNFGERAIRDDQFVNRAAEIGPLEVEGVALAGCEVGG